MTAGEDTDCNNYIKMRQFQKEKEYRTLTVFIENGVSQMVKVKNGKLVASNISFALPEDFYLTLQPTGCGAHLLEFKSGKRVVKGGIIYIDIEFENAELTAKEAMEEFAGDCDLHIKGDFKPVTRGKGTALSAHYYGGAYSDMYEERYDFPRNKLNQNQVSVSVQLMANRKGSFSKTIFEVLEMPNVKEFLGSIEYY